MCSGFLTSGCQCCSITRLVYALCVPATRVTLCKLVFLVYARKLKRPIDWGKLLESSDLPAEPQFVWDSCLQLISAGKCQSKVTPSPNLNSLCCKMSNFCFFSFIINIYRNILLFTQQVVLASSSLVLYILKYVFRGANGSWFWKLMHCNLRWLRETCLTWLKVPHF